MKEQSKPSKVNTVLLVILLVIGFIQTAIQLAIYSDTSETRNKVVVMEANDTYTANQISNILKVEEEQLKSSQDLVNQLNARR